MPKAAKLFDKSGLKQCINCEQRLPADAFEKDSLCSSGYRNQCMACRRDQQRKPGAYIGRGSNPNSGNKKTIGGTIRGNTKGCSACSKWLSLSEFNSDASKPTGYDYTCKACKADARRLRSSSSPLGFAKRKIHGYIANASGTSSRKRRLSGHNDLTPENFVKMWDAQNGLCAVTGIQMTHAAGNGRVDTNASIDRIDNSRGYVLDNMRLVCDRVNVLRGNMDDETMKSWCSAICNGDAREEQWW